MEPGSKPFGVTPGFVVSGSTPDTAALPGTTGTPLDTPAPGTPGDIGQASQQFGAAQQMQQQMRQMQQIQQAQAVLQQRELKQKVAASPAGQPLARQAAAAAGSPTAQEAFPELGAALDQAGTSISSVQADMPINTLIAQWSQSAPLYAAQLQQLLQSAQQAVRTYDGYASAPGAAAAMSQPVQKLGDNVDQWTLNQLLAFRQAVNSQYALE